MEEVQLVATTKEEETPTKKNIAVTSSKETTVVHKKGATLETNGSQETKQTQGNIEVKEEVVDQETAVLHISVTINLETIAVVRANLKVERKSTSLPLLWTKYKIRLLLMILRRASG